jgi:hypothetical protein
MCGEFADEDAPRAKILKVILLQPDAFCSQIVLGSPEIQLFSSADSPTFLGTNASCRKGEGGNRKFTFSSFPKHIIILVPSANSILFKTSIKYT